MPVNPDTGISWTDATGNHWLGCAKVSGGCKHCWAEGMALRFDRTPEPWMVDNIDANLDVYDENITAELASLPGNQWVFFPSSSDPFLPWLPGDAFSEWLEAMWSNDQHCFQVLTKWGPEVERSEQEALPHEYEPSQTAPKMPENAMLGVSVESPIRRYRIDWLREQDAQTKFVSFEPLVEEIESVDLSGIDWVIVGGESHPKEDERRDMDPRWAVTLYEEAREQGVPYFFKQHSGARAEGNRHLVVDFQQRKIEEFPETPGDLPNAPREYRGDDDE